MAQLSTWQHAHRYQACMMASNFIDSRSACITHQRLWKLFQLPTHAFRRRHDIGCSSSKRKLVFLGTPEVASGVLNDLVEASRQPDSTFEVSMVVTQPAKPRGRGNKSRPVPSPVEQAALALGLSADKILKPVKAKEEPFLSALQQLQPDLCVTAAYGNMLPTSFLNIPRHGTLNIHPSLLPKYRGAAPVPRALQDGVEHTGVSVAFTVLKCDAGPVLAQQVVPVAPDIQTPKLLQKLFKLGTQLLLSELPYVWEGMGPQRAVPQDEAQVSHAAKISKEEGLLDFQEPALQLHNNVRAFAGWPGTFAELVLVDSQSGNQEHQSVKVLQTRVHDGGTMSVPFGEASVSKAGMFIPCKDGSILEVVKVQPVNKKPMSAQDYANGLGSKRVLLAQSLEKPLMAV